MKTSDTAFSCQTASIKIPASFLYFYREEAFAKQHEISQESIRSFQQQFEIKNKEIHRLQSELDAVTSENKAHITAVENRRVANAREMEGLQQMFTDQLKNIEEEFTQRVDCVTRERDQIKQEYAQELQERDSHCKNLEKKLTEASKEVENLENERKRLQEDYDDVLKKLEEIKREKENADEKYSKELYQLRDDVIERDVKYYNLEKIKIEQEKLLKKLKADNKKLVKKMENAVGKRESECCELQQTVQELTRQIERVTKEREQVKEAYEELLADVRKELGKSLMLKIVFKTVLIKVKVDLFSHKKNCNGKYNDDVMMMVMPMTMMIVAVLAS